MKKLILIVLSLTLPLIVFATDPAVKSTKAYAHGYADGKFWAEENDVPPKNAKRAYQTMVVSDLAHANAGRGVSPYEIQAWYLYAQGWADAVFGEDADAVESTPRRTTPSTGGLTLTPGKGFYDKWGTGSTPVQAPAPTPPPTSTDLLNVDIMKQGEADGKLYGKRHSKEEKATPYQIREFAAKFAGKEGYTDEGAARDSYIEGFIPGYYEGAGIPEGK
jgi:hypothetical protein